MPSPSSWSRRHFLTTIAATGAGIVLTPWGAFALEELDPRVASIVATSIGIDTHNHIDVPLTTAEVPGPKIDLATELRRSGLSAICMTFATDYQQSSEPGFSYQRFLNGLKSMDEQLKNNDMKRAFTLNDLQIAKKAGLPIVIQSVEGCHFLEGKISRVEEAYDRGLRHIGLLHDSDASVPLGDVYTNKPQFGGLTKFGADVIAECDRLGILIDLAHCDKNTTAAALRATKNPVIISHTGLDTQLGSIPTMANMMKPRLISREQAKLVADAGGVIGVWTHLSDSPLEYAQNIRALTDIIGIDHVCLGIDTKLTPGYRPPNPNGEPDRQHKMARIGERTNEAWPLQKQGFYYAVVDALLKTGFTPEEIAKIGGGNFCRVFDAATKTD